MPCDSFRKSAQNALIQYCKFPAVTFQPLPARATTLSRKKSLLPLSPLSALPLHFSAHALSKAAAGLSVVCSMHITKGGDNRKRLMMGALDASMIAISGRSVSEKRWYAQRLKDEAISYEARGCARAANVFMSFCGFRWEPLEEGRKLMTRPEIVNMRSVFTITARAVDQCFVSYLLVLAAAFTLVGLSRHHQGVMILLAWLAHRHPQSRRGCIYWLCSSSQACPVCQHRSGRSSHLPFWF